MDRRIAAASLALISACGPALSERAGHAASASVPEAPAPPLASALTGDPAPPPESVGARDRALAADSDPGVQPPVLGIAVHEEPAPRPSRPAQQEGGGHHHAHHR